MIIINTEITEATEKAKKFFSVASVFSVVKNKCLCIHRMAGNLTRAIRFSLRHFTTARLKA